MLKIRLNRYAVAIVLLSGLTEIPMSYAVEGASVFKEECAECHSVLQGKNKKGPSLFGIVGRAPASIAGFNYSEGMRNNHTTWTTDRLDAYITGPKKVVPGGKMKYDGLANASERAALITYLESQH